MLNRPSRTSRQNVLLVFGAALGLSCGFGPVFLSTTGIFLKQIAASFNWSRGDIAVLPMVGMLGVSIGAFLIGYIADRKGWKQVIAFSIVLFALGVLAVSIAPASRAYIIAVGLFAGIAGSGTTPAGYTAVVSLAFDRRLGMALGLSAIGTGLGSIAVPIISGMLLEVIGWRQAYLCIGGFILVLGITAHQLIFRTLGTMESNSVSDKTARAAKRIVHAGAGVSFRQAIVGYRFWMIGVVSVLLGGITMGSMVHLASYATDRGITLAFAAQSAAVMGFGIAVARIGVGFILDKIVAPIVACCVCLLGAVGLYLLTTDIVHSAWVLPLSAMLIGFTTGGEGDLIPFMAKKYFGVRAFGSIYGLLMAAAGVGSALGSYGYGWSFDLFKSYVPVFQISAVVLCVCGLAMLTLGGYQYSSEQVAKELEKDTLEYAERDENEVALERQKHF